MSTLELFMKKNKKQRENTEFAATQSLKDENGNPLKWIIKPLTTKEDKRIRESCTVETPVEGKPNVFRPTLDVNKYLLKIAVGSVEFPNLYDAELQDSYGVKTPEDLLEELIDGPGEFNRFAAFIQDFNGFNVSLDEKVKEAKN